VGVFYAAVIRCTILRRGVMHRAVMLCVMLVIGTLYLARLADAQPLPPNGVWSDPAQGVVARLGPCAPENALPSMATGWCGVIASLPVDSNARRARPACGTMLFRNFVWDPARAEWRGRVRAPDSERTLGATARVIGDTMRVTVRVMLFTKSVVFTRLAAEETATRC